MEVKDVNGMKGLFAAKSYQKGDVICEVKGEPIAKPTRTSLQIGPNLHIDVKAPEMFINHKCNANISLKNNTFVAIVAIAKGEEITFNYFETEDIISSPFVCRDCGEWVKGKKFKAGKGCLHPINDLVFKDKGNIVTNIS